MKQIRKLLFSISGYGLYFGILLILNDVIVYRILGFKSIVIYLAGDIVFIFIGILFIKYKIIEIKKDNKE